MTDTNRNSQNNSAQQPDESAGSTSPKKKIKKNKRFYLKKYKINCSIGGYDAGTVVGLAYDGRRKTLMDVYWRRRLRDSERDNCMEVYKEKTDKKG